jgi:hypothetical protein
VEVCVCVEVLVWVLDCVPVCELVEVCVDVGVWDQDGERDGTIP